MKKNLISVVLRCAFIAVFLIFSASCGSRVNQSYFDKIQIGLTHDEVTEILGSPTDSSSASLGGFSGTASKWVGGSGTITIQFLNGKVWAKQFSRTEG